MQTHIFHNRISVIIPNCSIFVSMLLYLEPSLIHTFTNNDRFFNTKGNGNVHDVTWQCITQICQEKAHLKWKHIHSRYSKYLFISDDLNFTRNYRNRYFKSNRHYIVYTNSFFQLYVFKNWDIISILKCPA